MEKRAVDRYAWVIIVKRHWLNQGPQADD